MIENLLMVLENTIPNFTRPTDRKVEEAKEELSFLDTIQGDLLIRVDDHLPHRFTMTLPFDFEEQGTNAITKGTLQIDITFGKYNEEFRVAAPNSSITLEEFIGAIMSTP